MVGRIAPSILVNINLRNLIHEGNLHPQPEVRIGPNTVTWTYSRLTGEVPGSRKAFPERKEPLVFRNLRVVHSTFPEQI